MNSTSKFGKLIGVLDVSNSFCKFLVYAVKNREILTCHEISINKIESSDEDEYDPIELWNAVQEAMRVATENLVILEIEPSDIVAIGITNQRETTILWNKRSGEVLNPLCSSDNRLNKILEKILLRTKNKKNYLRSVCGLPFDVCFSAIKIKWLMENNKAVQDSIDRNECYFGNLDSWILWNLTGGIVSGVHRSDVTNCSRTMLMNLESLEWDKRLCKFFDIPMNILPQIRSCSEIYGYVNIQGSTVLEGVPIASVIGNNNSALVGQICLKAAKVECHMEEDCSVMINTGQEIIYSDNDLLSTVGFQLGPNEKVHYALEGFIGSSCSAINWLKSSILSSTESNNNHNSSPVSTFHGMRNGNCFKSLQENDLAFVPALKGLCAPKFLYQAKGFLSGLTINTTSQQLLTAAKESICFQTKTIVDSIKKDCKTWPAISSLIVGGEFSENVDFLQLLANICSVTIERPQVSAPTGLGCMLSAALTMKILSLDEFKTTCVPPVDNFYPTINLDVSEEKYMKWLTALKTSIQANHQSPRDEVNSLLEGKDATKFIMNSIPGCLFLFSSYVIYVLSQQWP
ncbi:CLUMA_CG008002, isoform A [Clunio marinus]|uniref:CLUMA_CG008002, isoform A n=1 Tax=Clunio marinus TaxID=568069 RepID=A0A1J1I7W7_9DIPT|nr:CLUMA_CG008002, isoform A [Clunio marinus]